MSWPSVKFKDVATVITGSTPKKNDENYDGDVPFVTPGDLGELAEISNAKVMLTKAGAKSARLLPANAVLVCCIGATIGKTGIAVVPVVTNQQINSLVFDETKVFPKYAYYFCKTLTPSLKHKSTSTTMPIVNKSSFSEIEIPLPPLREQKRIAAILDKADTIRRKRQQAIQLADDFLRAIFLDKFGDPVSNPMRWEVKPLKDLSLKIHSGNTPKGGKENYVASGVIFLRSQNVWKRKIILDDVAYIDEATHRKMTSSSLRNQDILMTKTGRFNTENSSLGRAAMFLGEDDSANVNGHVYLIRLDEAVDKQYILFILTMPEYYEYIRSVCVGGIDKRQLNKEHLENFPIIFPSIDLQQKFSRTMSMVDEVKIKAADALQKAEHMCDALSQKAFPSRL